MVLLNRVGNIMSTTKHRLTEKERLEIIKELEKKKLRSKRYKGRTYNITEGAVRKIWSNRVHPFSTKTTS